VGWLRRLRDDRLSPLGGENIYGHQLSQFVIDHHCVICIEPLIIPHTTSSAKKSAATLLDERGPGAAACGAAAALAALADLPDAFSPSFLGIAFQ